MTTLFDNLDDSDDSDELIPIPASASPSALELAERAERASSILDEIGFISGSAGITSAAILFVEDMQRRLQDSRDSKQEVFWCSEKQLEWLEAIYEKVS